uniref:Auxin response factor n=1 Tax=Cyrtomium guizhouense TaxID=306076 RepID=A0A1X9T685_9MONI|nr:auxin response factor 2 [Cyrtomium guizhouense]
MAFFRQGFAPPNSSMHADFSSLPAPLNPHTSIAMPGAAPLPFQLNAYNKSSHSDDYSDELWQACAGSLVSVPKAGECVWYFPQGHMEQVAASTQQACNQQLPNSTSLDSKVFCRVVSRTLSAEPDTDEVFAQISLLPEPEVTKSADTMEEEPVNPQRSIRMFTKILTASDTSTHGGFSVLRKHAEDCLPLLDMSQDPPFQDLVATDLHGQEWKFRHTYRGHPRRHLLTTGWSVFVSNKRLVAGDAVIFLRGENGELRVGIRRAKRQPVSQPSVLSSHSMHMGVVATASYAITTRTMFSVYYKPRVSLSTFLVPVHIYTKAMAQSLSVGMRFKMKCETDDGSERSYAGTITGLGGTDASSWPNSKWRSLIVNWDEMTNERAVRVSPWEIEPCASPPMVNPSPTARNKRFRPVPFSSATDLPILGSNNSAYECTFSPKYSRVVQGQEPWMGVGSLWRSSLNNNLEPQHPQQHKGASGAPLLQVSGLRTTLGMPLGLSSEGESKLSTVSPISNRGGRLSKNTMHGSSWPVNDFHSGWFMPISPSQAGLSSVPTLVEKSLETVNSRHPSMYHPLAPSFPFNQEMPEVVSPAPVVAENSCKLFGISLTDISPTVAGAKFARTVTGASVLNEDITYDESQQPYIHVKDVESPKPTKSDAASEQERPDLCVSREADLRSQSVRSCTKVIKKGSMVGRGIDLSKIDSYKKLIEELEVMFHMKGELADPDKGWQVAYSDNEGDFMHVGDDPWPEFCIMVRKIYILSPEEVLIAGLPEGKGPKQCR